MKLLSYKAGILYSTAGSFLSRFLAVISGVILAKSLSPDLLGKFFSDQALVLLGLGFINLGVGQAYRQIVSRNPELRDTFLPPVILIRFSAMLLYFGVLAVYLYSNGRWSTATVLVVLGTLLLNFVELLQIDLQIFRQYLKATVLISLKGTVLFIPAVICYIAVNKYDWLVFSYLITTIAALAIGWLLVKPVYSSLLNFNYWNLLKISVPFCASLFAFSFTNYWAITYIREVLGEYQAGLYSVPLKVYQITMILGTSVTGVTLPLYHKLAYSQDFDTFKKVHGRLIKGLFFLGGLIVGICFFCSEPLVKILATKEYLNAAALFPWIGFGVMFHLLAIPIGNILESVNRQWWRVVIQSIAAVVCVLLVVLVVPEYGINGAAWTLFIVDSFLLLGYCIIAKYFAPQALSLTLLLLSCFLLAIAVFIISKLSISIWWQFILFCLVWELYVIYGLKFKTEFVDLLKSFKR